MSILGTRVIRSEDPRFLTTGGVYTADVRDEQLTGACHVHFVRSAVAHGRISAIDVSAARQAPGPQGGGHAGAASLAGVPAPVAAAHVLVGSDQTWMKPAAAPCWKLSPCS